MKKLFYFLIVLIVIAACNYKEKKTEGISQNNSVAQDRNKSNIAKEDTFNNESKETTIGFLISAGRMKAARAAHSATVLKSGKVLIAGGFTGSTLASAEVYDPELKKFTIIGQMSVPRASHSASLLPDGKVLIAGGYNGNYLSGTEIFDPQTQTFSAGPEMNIPRSGHTATILDNGKILFTGGTGVGWSFLQSAELYDIKAKTFKVTGSMATARESHTATLLKDGNVLITGGHKGRRANIKIYSSAELYNPVSEKFEVIGNMNIIRHKHDAVRLADGSVFINGGSDERDSGGTYASAELYNPDSSVFKPAGNMNFARYKHNGTSILLSNGNVLITGGANRAEIYQPSTGKYSIVNGNYGTELLFSCSTLLQNGQVLITGGYNENQETIATAWIYKE